MRITTLTEILGDFTCSPAQLQAKNGATLTLWVPVDVKARYDKLQEQSGRRFSKKAREALIALIDAAEKIAG